jgi:hypothetical protein
MRLLGAALLLLSFTVLPSLGEAKAPRSTSSSQAVQSEAVSFNTKTHKYHKPSCTWAKRCTRNCVSVPKSEAESRGGVPCKVCGG